MNLVVNPLGLLECSGQSYRCALGRGGVKADKHEGDGTTPVGTFTLGRVFYRPDRVTSPPQTGLPILETQTNMGWCDDEKHSDYNHLITLPHPAHHEELWRRDRVYDLIVEILYNTAPVVAGRGSAIFMHIAKPDYTPTEGCIALKYEDLLSVLRCCNEGDTVTIPSP